MKVSGVNNIAYNSKIRNLPSFRSSTDKKTQINEPMYVTPDFSVKTPVMYKKTGTYTLENGLEMYTYKLSNGYKVSIVPMEGSPSVVKTYVNVGSMNENPKIKGISHFLEHMAFNGTNGENGHIKLETGDSFKKIDELGGWANASTNYAITDYVNSAPLLEDSDLETQIKVLSAMTEDLKLSEDMIKKEKGPVSSEINMIMDDPQTIAMDQTVRSLFNIKNPADELVGGSVTHIQNLTRKDVVDYYNTYYTPDNTCIVITGDVNPEEAISLVSKNFTSKKISKGQKYEEKITPIQKTVRKDFSSDKATSSEIVIGFAGPPNNNAREQVLYNIAHAYMNSQEVGLYKALKKFNAGYAIDSQKISTNPNNPRMIYLGTSVSDKNTEDTLKSIFDTIKNIKPATEETTELLKKKMKTSSEEYLEHSDSVNDYIGLSMVGNNIEYITDYNKILDSITPEDVDNAVKKYFDISKCAITVVHPQTNNENISFKGHRIPVDMQKTEVITTNNNYDTAFYNTKTKKIDVKLNMTTKEPYIGKAGADYVLNEILRKGALGSSEDEFDEFLDKNNLQIAIGADKFGITAFVGGDKDNYQKGLEKLKEVLYNPNITEENLKETINNIKDSFERKQDSANSLYNNYNAQTINYAYTDEEILKSLDTLTVDDIKELHQYLLDNASGVITANLPSGFETEVKNAILNYTEGLNEVKPNEYSVYQEYKPYDKTEVLTKVNNNSQADITEVFKFKAGDDSKEIVTGMLMNYILSSSSIGLFDVLREKENLAYSVFSDIGTCNDTGELSLNILTTTDNKTIGEFSYDNVKKSINGFNRQISELISGNFTDKDLENAKRSMKASFLNNEGNSAKLSSLSRGLESKYGIEYKNILYNEIDNITKEDIMNYAKYVFSNKPTYAIVASQDTLNANEEFLNSLKC